MSEMEDKRASRVASARKRTTFALKSKDGTSKASFDLNEKSSNIDVYNEPLFNPDGTRNEKVPFCLFVSRKMEEERRAKKKNISISNASRKERKMFENAIKKLKAEKQMKAAERCQYLKSLTKARRTHKKEAPKKPPPKTALADGRGDDVSACPISCPRPLFKKPSKTGDSTPKKLTPKDLQEIKKKEVTDHLKAIKKAREKKQLVKYPPVKTKKWEPPKTPVEALIARGIKPKPRPVIQIPPIKTKKWVPEPIKPERKKIVIEYPPVKLRPKKPLKQIIKKKIKPKMRLDKVFYPVPSSTLGRRWHAFKCLSKYQILRGSSSQYSKKFNFVTNGKQSTFIATVALAFAKFHSMANWKSEHIDEIILYGDINCRKQIKKFKHQNVIKPCEIANKIYLKRAKVFVELCERVEKGCFELSDTKDIRTKIEEVLKQYSSLLITYCGQSYAIWSDESAFYIFNSEDTNENGILVERARGAGCAIRSSSLNNVIDYLIGNFKATKQRFEIFSFKDDKVIKIEEELAKLCPQTKAPEKVEDEEEIEEIIDIPEVFDEQKQPKSGLASILFRYQPEPIFGDSFQKSFLPNHGFLIGANFLQKMEENRAPFISSVAVLMLRACKSSLWQSSTLSKIFTIGHSLFTENVENHFKKIKDRKLQLEKAMEPDPLPPKDPNEEEEDDDEDEEDEFSVANIRARRKARKIKPKIEVIEKQEFPITEFEKLIVKLGNLQFELNVENLILGKIITRKPEEISLKVGLDNLFKKFDHGLILGPDTVAVWREQNNYFMFDANRCQGYTRADEFSDSGNSCLHWFKDLGDLAQMYIDNLKKDQRSMTFKICKIESKEFVDKARDWQSFKAINGQKWILSGKISESSEEFKASNRGHQSTCISLIALAKSKDQGIISWCSKTIDEIVRMGDEFYTGCVIKLKEKEEFVSPQLDLNEIGTEFKLENAIADFTFEESAICGKLQGNDGTLMTFHTGLEVFFENDEMGVVMTGGVSYAIMKFDGAFFLFDCHDRDEMGRNIRTLDPNSICAISGSACILRFMTISDLASHLLSNIEVGDASTYTINKIDVALRTSDGPCLYFYKPFGKNSNAAILRAFDDLHEDVESFKSEIEAKTLCNLFSALCFTRIIQPNQWSRMDVNEILKIGYKLLCNVAADPDSIWEKLSEVEVCGVNFKSEKLEEIFGVFIPIEKILPEIDGEKETIEENIQIAEIERRETLRKSRASNVTVPTLMPERKERTSQEGDQSSLFPPLDSKAAERIPLMEILNSWSDRKEVLSILTSSLFNIAIFKMNRVIFVFDPKASSDFGGLIQKRYDDFIKRYLKEEYSKLVERCQAGNNKRLSKEEEFQELLFGRPVAFGALTVKPSQYVISMNESEDDPIMISEKGCAYVAWFTTPELAFEHILSKIPEKFRNHPFTMHEFKIVREIKEVQLSPWNNFTPITENRWILRATFSQNDTQFPPSHRNNQDVPNCLMSLMFARLCNENDWNSTVLDVILKLGDRLFKKSLESQMAKNAIPISNLKLELSHLVLPVFIRPFIINVESELVKRDMMIKLDDKSPLENFKEVLNNFLVSSSAGLLKAKKYHVAIWKCQDEGLMMFDPHDIGPDGIKKSTGFACLQRFLNHFDLADTFFANIKDIDGLNEFELIKINLIMDDYKDGKDEQFESQFDEVCVPKTILAKSTQLRNDGVPMTICYAIATLCVSRSLDPEYYTPDIIDRIILLGNELSHECLMNDEVCFKDFDLGAKSTCPDEINWNFQLNDTFANIQMDIFQRGVISKDPSPLPNLIFSLEEFFNFYSIGLLITCEFITAMWKEDGKYFIFYSCPIDERGRRNGDMKAAPGLVSFNAVAELYGNILSNTKIDQAPFELRICSIAMSDLIEEKEICGDEVKKIVKTEIVMPAIAIKNVKNSEGKIENIKNQDMIEAIKKKKTEGYLKYKLGGFICGCLAKNSKSFNEVSRKYQSPAICVICAAMTAIREPHCWTSEIIDAIVTSGNNLYFESSLLHLKKEIEITEVVSALCIGDHKISVKVESCMQIAQKALKNEHLMALFDALFGCRKTCYVAKKFDCWLLMKFGKFIFLFDPLGIVFPGKKRVFNRATLYRLDSTKKAVQQLMECIKDASNDEDETEIDVGGIYVKNHPKSQKPKLQELKRDDEKKCKVIENEGQYEIVH